MIINPFDKWTTIKFTAKDGELQVISSSTHKPSKPYFEGVVSEIIIHYLKVYHVWF